MYKKPPLMQNLTNVYNDILRVFADRKIKSINIDNLVKDVKTEVGYNTYINPIPEGTCYKSDIKGIETDILEILNKYELTYARFEILMSAIVDNFHNKYSCKTCDNSAETNTINYNLIECDINEYNPTKDNFNVPLKDNH